MADFNQTDADGANCLLSCNTAEVQALTELHNSGQNSDLRTFVRAMIEMRLKESAYLQAWMDKRGIAVTPTETDDAGGAGGDTPLMY